MDKRSASIFSARKKDELDEFIYDFSIKGDEVSGKFYRISKGRIVDLYPEDPYSVLYSRNKTDDEEYKELFRVKVNQLIGVESFSDAELLDDTRENVLMFFTIQPINRCCLLK